MALCSMLAHKFLAESHVEHRTIFLLLSIENLSFIIFTNNKQI